MTLENIPSAEQALKDATLPNDPYIDKIAELIAQAIKEGKTQLVVSATEFASDASREGFVVEMTRKGYRMLTCENENAFVVSWGSGFSGINVVKKAVLG